MLAASGAACTPASDDVNLTGISGLGTSDGATEDTGSNDTGTDEGTTGDPDPNCGPQPPQCAELIECLSVVLPDIDVSDIEPGGSCWCGTTQDAIECRDLCVDQLEIVENQYPNVEECGGGSTTTDPTGDGDGDGDGDPGPLPNLTLDQFYLGSHLLAPGAAVNYYFELVNNGPVDTMWVYQDRVILSVNDVFGDDDDFVIHAGAFEFIVEANENYLYYIPITLPDDLVNGEYYVALELDYTNVINESDETDNWRFDADKLVIMGEASVDLAPSDALASEYAVKTGTPTDVSVTVDNLGLDDIGPYTVRFYYSSDQNITNNDTLLCSVNAPGLAGNSATVVEDQCMVPELEGDYYLGVIVDPSNVIAETDETNNIAFDPALVTISPLDVDLQPSMIGTGSLSVGADDLVAYSATVTNNGADPTPPFSIAFYYSLDANITQADKLICQVNGPALQPGASAPINTNCDVPLIATANYRLGVIVDPNNVINETNEANNTAVHPNSVSVTAPIVDLEYSFHGDNLPFFANPGQNISYTLDVWNNGSAPSGPFSAKMVWSVDANITNGDIEGCTVALASIPPLTMAHYVFPCTVPDFQIGNYYSGAIIDPTNAVPETVENNNIGVSFDAQIFN
ncbi:Fibronectin type III domain protein [Enhygromyxa salina]|uniref:Fibronectin type III domain protein n=1 Tax=Enhygromyxa salina TaxID=215803 RepID=A0A0C2A0N9_9BACT|nr:Fibronectin type III domain protein [Enhygromyxa salina]